MTHLQVALVILTLLASCEDRPTRPSQSDIPAGATALKEPASDETLGRMVSDVAAAKACDMIRGRWAGMYARARPTITGTLQIERCDVMRDGDRWRFAIGVSGWQWRNAIRTVPSSTHEPRDYDHFGATVTLYGSLELGFDESTRTASVRFRTDRPVDVQIVPERRVPGDIVIASDVDESIVAAIVEALVRSGRPKGLPFTARLQPLEITATVPLCVGTWFFSVTGEHAGADLGSRAPTELGREGIALHGPFANERSVTLLLAAQRGSPRVSLVCERDAVRIADAFARGKRIPRIKPLASTIIRGKRQLRVTSARCPVVMFAQATGKTPQEFTWSRLAAESTVLRLPSVHCATPPATTMKAAPP